MEARSVLTALRRNKRTAIGLALLVAYGGCAIPWRQLGDEYGGTVVDAQSGEPIEGAVMLVTWLSCTYIALDSPRCGGVYSPLEAVSAPDGRISMDGTPWLLWNPLGYLSDFPFIEIRAVGYVPLSSWFYSDPSFDGLDGAEFAKALRQKPRIALSRPEHFDGWRNPRKTPREQYEWLVTRPQHVVRVRDLPKVPNFRRVLNLQRAEFGLPPMSGEPRR